MTNPMRTHLRWFPLLLLVAACKVGPDYEVPELPQPDAWSEELRNGVLMGTDDLSRWWDKFNDPVLTDLIRRADEGNLDLKIAIARIKESRALLGIARSDWAPQVAATGSIEAGQVSNNNPNVPPGAQLDAQDLYSLGGEATWEIDVWGRIARSVESSGANLSAQYEDYRDVRVSLFSSVATNYMRMRAAQARIAFAQNNVKQQQDSLGLAQSRFKAGVSPELDVAQAQSNLGSTEALIPLLEQQRVATVLRIAVLLGVHPQKVREVLKEVKPIPEAPAEVTVGAPANILRQRPDIRAAERALASQTARIGVATAELYPQFNISGFFAFETGNLSKLFDSDSITWGLGMPIRWNIFAGGRIRDQIEAEKARTEGALSFYERSILRAVEEVERSMNRYTQEQDRRDALKRAVAAAQRTVTLSLDLYKQGLVNFQNVLDAQRSLNDFQDALAQSEGLVVIGLVGLYTSLGGGWQELSEDQAKKAAEGEAKKKAPAAKA